MAQQGRPAQHEPEPEQGPPAAQQPGEPDPAEVDEVVRLVWQIYRKPWPVLEAAARTMSFDHSDAGQEVWWILCSILDHIEELEMEQMGPEMGSTFWDSQAGQ